MFLEALDHFLTWGVKLSNLILNFKWKSIKVDVRIFCAKLCFKYLRKLEIHFLFHLVVVVPINILLSYFAQLSLVKSVESSLRLLKLDSIFTHKLSWVLKWTNVFIDFCFSDELENLGFFLINVSVNLGRNLNFWVLGKVIEHWMGWIWKDLFVNGNFFQRTSWIHYKTE